VFRVWVAGCASGEEAYSIAIVMRELMSESQKDFSVQIYATDLDDDAIAIARAGVYPPNIAQDVTLERLRRFFSKDDTGYKVNKELREMVVFAVQNVIKDPPFTKLDLLSCRNLLIYLETEQQERLIPTFHYALKPDGVLFLSTSESITSQPELFSALNRKWKFYRASHAPSTASRAVPSGAAPRPGTPETTPANIGRRVDHPAKAVNVAELSHRLLLQAYAPASVTTDLAGNILYIHGDTGRYLCAPPGPVTTRVVDMAREGLQLELRTALLDAATKATPTLDREVSMQTPDGMETVRFSVRLLPLRPDTTGGNDENLLLVSFQDGATDKAGARRGKGPRAGKSALAARLEQLERELAYARNNLQATTEEHQATNEELQSANEELQSANEELQSSNEEMETSQEELQSLNEETITVNTELNARIVQLNGIQNDMKNLLDNINIGTLFLDQNLMIRLYTRETRKIFRLIAGDVGRPLEDIKSNIEGEDLQADLQSVLETLIPRERELRTHDGAWYLARIQPYRTLDNVIEGVVLSFTAVTDFKRASEKVRLNEAILATAQEIAHLGSWELDVASGRTHCSAEMFRIFGVPPLNASMTLQDVLNTLSAEDAERVTRAIQTAVDSGTDYDVAYGVTRPDGTKCQVRSRALPIRDPSGKVTQLVGTSLQIAVMPPSENRTNSPR
jgi:two-component system CheB/CheR fusion protein